MKTKQARKKTALNQSKEQFKIPFEFNLVHLRDCPMDNPLMYDADDLVTFWRRHVTAAPWYKAEKECLCIFLLNTRKKLTGFELVSQGTLDKILTHPREVLRPAIVLNAAGFIIAHNHPSGDPLPSLADVTVTKELIAAAILMRIELVDHIIIGDERLKNSYASLRELGYFYSEKGNSKAARN